MLENSVGQGHLTTDEDHLHPTWGEGHHHQRDEGHTAGQ